jgi:hypothetical protein
MADDQNPLGHNDRRPGDPGYMPQPISGEGIHWPDPAVKLAEAQTALRLAAAENLALRNALAEAVGHCVSPRTLRSRDGILSVEVHPDSLERWQAALAGQMTMGDERPEPAPVLRGGR